MTEEEMKDFLRENLRVSIEKKYDWSDVINLTVAIYLGDEKISEDYISA